MHYIDNKTHLKQGAEVKVAWNVYNIICSDLCCISCPTISLTFLTFLLPLCSLQYPSFLIYKLYLKFICSLNPSFSKVVRSIWIASAWSRWEKNISSDTFMRCLVCACFQTLWCVLLKPCVTGFVRPFVFVFVTEAFFYGPGSNGGLKL